MMFFVAIVKPLFLVAGHGFVGICGVRPFVKNTNCHLLLAGLFACKNKRISSFTYALLAEEGEQMTISASDCVRA